MITLLIPAVVLAGAFFWSWKPTWLFNSAGVVWIVVIVNIAALLIASSRLKRRLREHAFRLCLQCQYPLSPEPMTGTCPECGAAYHLDEIHGSWKASRWGDA